MDYKIQAIQPEHDRQIGEIIKKIGKEYDAIGDGFGPSDPEVIAMSQHYHDQQSSLYLVAVVDQAIVGGSGVASFSGSHKICELRKLFLLPESRGFGLGEQLAVRCLEYAKNKGYKQCYLDTLSGMKSAISLYKKLGFKQLEQPLTGTAHNRCDVWMLKSF